MSGGRTSNGNATTPTNSQHPQNGEMQLAKGAMKLAEPSFLPLSSFPLGRRWFTTSESQTRGGNDFF
eukprot:scaffold25527_cov31-Tisochrysis_lutea.AAC.6